MSPLTFYAVPKECVSGHSPHCFPNQFLCLVGEVWNGQAAWDAMWIVLSKDEAGNPQLSDALTTDCRNTLARDLQTR
jgi:hypothetical protein